MTTAANPTTHTVALVGNPNTGKSTLFNALAGVRQRTGNYPGVTVERKIGHFVHAAQRYALIDLPGTYSLAPRSPDEMVAVDVLLGRRADTPAPEVVVCIVDASNLERNLYLVSQVLELGLPTVVALNMIDVARDHGLEIDTAELALRLGVPVVPIQANARRGLDALKSELAAACASPQRETESPFPEAFREEVGALEAYLRQRTAADRAAAAPAPRYLVERLLLDTSGYLEQHELARGDAELRRRIAEARERLTAAGMPVPAVEAMARYGWVGQVLDGVLRRPATRRTTWSDQTDKVLTHWLWGNVIFAVLMVGVFQAVFSWAIGPMNAIDQAAAWAGEMVSARLPEGALQSLLVDGLIAGVGGVLVFLPQILILFLFIAILEDCGYMARAAYLMDRLMVPLGLSGKSFIPLLSSFACAIPGVMATRVIENRRDRLTTILIAPLMSCSARLPVYILLTAAFIPSYNVFSIGFGWLAWPIGLQGLTMAAMYLLGIVVAAGVAFVLKRTLLRGPTPPFVLELPAYKWPSPSTVVYRMVDRGWSFVRRAGTLIVAVSIVVWAALYFPRADESLLAPLHAQQQQRLAELDRNDLEDDRREQLEAELTELDNALAGVQQRQSILGRMGRLVEPVVRPLGWDWRIGCAAIASFPAREVVVSTLGIIFNQGSDVDVEEDESLSRLAAALRDATWDDSDRPLFNIPVALSLMVFFALCAQCAATLVVIRRETNSWGWPLFTFAYMTLLAYLGAMVTYQVGMWFV